MKDQLSTKEPIIFCFLKDKDHQGKFFTFSKEGLKTFNFYLVLHIHSYTFLDLSRLKGKKLFRKCSKRIVFMIIELVKYPVLTEKSVRLLDSNQYTFDVDIKLTKPQIKNLIEDAFQVNVIAVNTHRPPRKKKRLGYTQGYKPLYKRVIISVKRGQAIQVLPTD